jgi:hypothetical protein
VNLAINEFIVIMKQFKLIFISILYFQERARLILASLFPVIESPDPMAEVSSGLAPEVGVAKRFRLRNGTKKRRERTW